MTEYTNLSIEDIILKYHKSSNHPTNYKTSTLTKGKVTEIRNWECNFSGVDVIATCLTTYIVVVKVSGFRR